MKKWKEKIGNLSIRKKFIFYTYLVIMPILIILCIAIAVYRYDNIRRNYENRQWMSVNSLSSALGMMENDVRNLSLSLAVNEEIQDILLSADADTLNLDDRLWQNHTPMLMMEDLLSLMGNIKTVAIYPENGVLPYLRCIDVSSYQTDTEQVRQTESYQKAVALKGKGLWVSVPAGESEIYQANRTGKLVLCRAVYNTAKTRLLGYITVGISVEGIEELCRISLNSGDEGIILLDAQGEELLEYGTIDGDIRQCFYGDVQEELHEICGDREIYGRQVSDNGWKIRKVVSRVGIRDSLYEILYIPLLLMLGVTVGILPLLQLMSVLISKPLETVCAAMGKFQQGDFEQRVEIRTHDEIGEVAVCFNQMVHDIQQLINTNYIIALKERESELAVLQAQINPHFLYNALDSIYWQAMNHEDEETADSIYELSQLFRLMLGQGKGLVTVEMELELVRRYLEVQKLRFMEQMEYEIAVDDNVLNEKIPKLIIQPFVENALVHGMQADSDDFRIIVSASRSGGFLEIRVRDNGAGMDETQLQKIWEEDEEKAFSGQRIGRYAIRNVRQRLTLKYENEYELRIESRVGEGTLVVIRLPAGIKE